jgi:hypothetical protein
MGKSSKSWGSQRLTEAMTNPVAISVDLKTRGNVNLAGLSAIFKASPIVKSPDQFSGYWTFFPSGPYCLRKAIRSSIFVSSFTPA